MFFAINLTFATKHHHSDEHEVRYIKENRKIDANYQQILRNSNLWQNFITNYSDWFVIFNESNQLPHRAFGTPIPVNDFESFLGDNNFVIPVDVRESSVVKNDKYINKLYTQYHNNLGYVCLS